MGGSIVRVPANVGSLETDFPGA